ncbi:DoxX family protein [Streptomyces sp. DG2A-72]|uniref:DoxX family protein n=1 Tax=Streptomyces sp. DG2A-72 TaxID=3051386 RepID=UPI00265C39CC|nr:DoxX family protein [Streptomyces sp. DG2A-72]MDO0939417.1 DoxX family protein [Streptomyces sp. DG2A-72]
MRIYGIIVCSLERFGASFGVAVLRISIGVIFLWFGAPKLFPGMSPAESLVEETVERLTFGIIGGGAASFLTGGLESIIGILLISGKALRPTIVVLLGHMAGTFTPLFIFPEHTWKGYAIGTVEGQYILKNLVLIAAALVVIGHSKSRIGKASPPESPLLGVAASRATGILPAGRQLQPVPVHRAEARRQLDLGQVEK